MIDELIKFSLMVMAGCGALFMLVFTFWLLHAFIPFLFDAVRKLFRYASGKYKDNE
jgi:hypothetical protein